MVSISCAVRARKAVCFHSVAPSALKIVLTFHWRFMSALIYVYLHAQYFPPCTLCVDGWIVSVCVCACVLLPGFLRSTNFGSGWEADQCNKEGGKIKRKKQEKKEWEDRLLIIIPFILRQRSQGLFLSPLRSRSNKQADCDVISCLFLVLLLFPPLRPFHCLSKIKV